MHGNGPGAALLDSPVGAVVIPMDREDAASAARGDVRAFERLYRAHNARVHSLARRMAGPEHAADLTQEIFVRAWQRLGTFRGDSAFSSWLHPLTVNVALSERRARRRRTSRFVTTDDLTPFEKPGKAGGPEEGMDLERALATLPPGARSVFVLHDVEGLDHREVGAALGISEGTSKSQVHKARMKLRVLLRGMSAAPRRALETV